MYLAKIKNSEHSDRYLIQSIMTVDQSFKYSTQFAFEISQEVFELLQSQLPTNDALILKSKVVAGQIVSNTTDFTFESRDNLMAIKSAVVEKIYDHMQMATGPMGMAYFWAYLMSWSKLFNLGYVVTDENREIKTAEILQSGNIEAINALEEHINNMDRFYYTFKVYKYALNVFDFIKTSTDFAAIENSYNVYLNAITGAELEGVPSITRSDLENV
jgi:hypothetical protein